MFERGEKLLLRESEFSDVVDCPEFHRLLHGVKIIVTADNNRLHREMTTADDF